ncbi:delta-like protein C [Actinia tenebrosa]|uniref:Delta-like protein C n=1 Tax=Actinia tenebrosa TaxID=6105 RepID=A0A6P8INF4_ACTTE|nr:delta-like protein C [Actinia tenebrosa]
MKAFAILWVLSFAIIFRETTSSEITFNAAKQPYYRTPKFGYLNFVLHPNSTLEVENKRRLVACASNMTCFSINFGKQPIFFYDGNPQYLCELLATDKYNSSSKYKSKNPGFDHYSIRCLHDFTCIPDYDNDTYECLCPRPAYEGKHCKDVNECTSGHHDCSVNATCTNTIGSFNCTCKNGYLGNGRNCTEQPTTVSDPCHSNPCLNAGTCQVQRQEYTCICAGQTTGANCENEAASDPCHSSPCLNGGTCQVQGQEYTCICAGQTTGANCETSDKVCTGSWTSKQGNCYLVINEYLPWNDAESRCVSEGGHLVSIHSESENEAVVNLIGMEFWIGLSDTETEGTYKWTDGTQFDFNKFEKSLAAGKGCILAEASTGKWKKIGCTSGYKQFICKY